jgi:hypothetical protein
MDLEDVERQLRDRLDAIGTASRAVFPHVLTLPHHQRASRMGEFFGDPRTQRSVLRMIREKEGGGP